MHFFCESQNICYIVFFRVFFFFCDFIIFLISSTNQLPKLRCCSFAVCYQKFFITKIYSNLIFVTILRRNKSVLYHQNHSASFRQLCASRRANDRKEQPQSRAPAIPGSCIHIQDLSVSTTSRNLLQFQSTYKQINISKAMKRSGLYFLCISCV